MPFLSFSIMWVVVAAAGWLVLATVAWWCDRSPPSPRPDLRTGLVSWVVSLYCRWVHGLSVTGLEHLAAAQRARVEGRGVIVTANHAAGIDPLLVQSAVRRGTGLAVEGSGRCGGFYIRWVAASETIAPLLRSFVEFADVVFVAAGGAGSGGGAGGGGGGGGGVRAVVRVLRGEGGAGGGGDGGGEVGGVIGLFPEGRIVRPRGEGLDGRCITPFQPGVGLMVSRGGALVLPVVIRGVPIRSNTYLSFLIPSRSRVEFHAPIEYGGERPAAIVADLEARYTRWIGPVVPPVSSQAK